MTKITIIIMAAAALAAGFWFANQQQSPINSQISGFAYPAPAALEGIQLVDHNNKPFDESFFKGKWTFVYVGYTFCPDACPMTLTILDQLRNLLQENGDLQDNISMMLVSVDPARDTPERLNSYINHFNDRFVAATGDPEHIKAFTRQVSAIYVVPENPEDPNYLVDHSSTVILIDPNAAVHALFTPPQQAENLAKDFKVIRDGFS